MKAFQCRSHRAFGEVGRAGDGGIARVEAACRKVEEVEDQRVKDLQAGMADGATVASLLLGLPIELLGIAPQADRDLLRQRRELDGLGRAAGPDGVRGVGLLCQGQQARQKSLPGRLNRTFCSAATGPPTSNAQRACGGLLGRTYRLDQIT
jgi:hypothetical protein